MGIEPCRWSGRSGEIGSNQRSNEPRSGCWWRSPVRPCGAGSPTPFASSRTRRPPGRSTDHGLERLVFSQRQSAVRSGFRMRYGPAQISWPHLRPQRYGGNARAGRPHNPC